MGIGENIKRFRHAAGLTQQELADLVGTSKATICRYERGVIENIPSDKIENIAKCVDVSPSEIMGWKTQNKMPVSSDSDRLEALLKDNPQLKVLCNILEALPIDALEVARAHLDLLLSQQIQEAKKKEK
jgi:transcriptional regulator with XRE-family HTH domain